MNDPKGKKTTICRYLLLAGKAGRKNDLSIAPNQFDKLKNLTNSEIALSVSNFSRKQV
jgi:hypothetical protein